MLELEARSTGGRLHPLSPVFEIARSFTKTVVPGLLVLFFAARDRHEAWYMLAFVPATIIALFRYFTLRYELLGVHLVIREGLLFRKTRHIPFARIQNIDTVQNPLHRLFGVAEVRLETASGEEPEAVFRVLSLSSLEQIRAGVFGDHARSDASSPMPSAPQDTAPRPFFRMGTLDVALFGVLRQRGMALFSGLLLLGWEFDVWQRVSAPLGLDAAEVSRSLPFFAWVALALVLLLLLQALAVLWALVMVHDFYLVRNGEDLRTSCGLWTRQSAALPRHRIQFLSVRESGLHRLFHRVSVKALSAGGDSTRDSQITRKWLVPLCERAELSAILAEVQPEVSFEGLDWTPVHPRARRRIAVRWFAFGCLPVLLFARHAGPWIIPLVGIVALLAYALATLRARRLAYAQTPHGLLLRDGVWTWVRNAVLFDRIQAVSLHQNPFDRRLGMASLHLDTAGADSELSFVIPYLDLRVARRLMRSVGAAVPRKPFRW